MAYKEGGPWYCTLVKAEHVALVDELIPPADSGRRGPTDQALQWLPLTLCSANGVLFTRESVEEIPLRHVSRLLAETVSYNLEGADLPK